MPIEIKELVIRAVVGKSAVDPMESNDDSVAEAATAPRDTSATEDVVQECVRQVLRILEKNKER